MRIRKAAPQKKWKTFVAADTGTRFFYNPYRINIGKDYKNLGTRVISAQNIEGNANVKSLSAKQSCEEGKKFSDWIVDNFLCCLVGDTSKRILETAFGESPDLPIQSTFHNRQRRSITQMT
jgi:hypothetical protein